MTGDSQLRHEPGSQDPDRPGTTGASVDPALSGSDATVSHHGDAPAAAATGAAAEEREQEAEPPAVAPTPPITGDEAVDEAMTRLAQAQAGSFAERIEAGEHAHRSLQSRLGGLGGA